jgi:alkylation response protein AidB-like acyl-CoA dehydrogenase
LYFQLTEAQNRLLERCRALAADFAMRAAAHDREASHPAENYERLRAEGFCAFNIPKHWGGQGHGLLDHTLAIEALAQGCPSTALAFNMHLSVVGPLTESRYIPDATKAYIGDLAVAQRKLIAGNFSEPTSTALIGERHLGTRARQADGGYRITGRKMFASMLEAADYCAVLAYPDSATSPTAGLFVLVPRQAEGRRVEANWDTLGMRATRSDALILEDCWVPERAALYQADDIRPFRTDQAHWFWASYTPVYLGVAAAAYDEIVRVLKERRPPGYAQPLAYHPDARRQVAQMSVELEAARLVTYHSAWLSDARGPTPETLAALHRAKYLVGEATGRITRMALGLGGAHAIFKGKRLEQLFRDGALAPIQAPQADFCLHNIGLHALGLDPDEVLPPLKRE